jgi:hypothetical protein
MAMEQQLINANRQIDLSRIPLWSGTKDTAFSAEQWVERIDKARAANAGNWNDATTMSYVFNALRGDALVWFDALPTLGYDTGVWDDFKAAFIRTYGTTKTARTAALNLSDIKQGPSESSARYISRVIKLIADVKDLAPALLPQPAQPFADEIRALAGYAGVPDAVKTAMVQTLLKAGAQDAYNRVGMQLFIAGLRPNLRTELMKSNPATMREAFDFVIDAEKICAEPKKGAFILAVNTEGESDAENDADNNDNNQEDEEDNEICALNAKIKLLKKKAAAKKNKANKPSKNGQNGQSNKQRSDGSRAQKSGACRYCKKEGHYQAECYSRKAANAPMVDAQGNPFSTGGSRVHALQGGYAPQHQQQQQQHHLPQHNPYAHYMQGEQAMGGGGVGAIWNAPQQEFHLNY